MANIKEVKIKVPLDIGVGKILAAWQNKSLFLVATVSSANPPFPCQMMHGLLGNNGCMHCAWAAWLTQLRPFELTCFVAAIAQLFRSG